MSPFRLFAPVPLAAALALSACATSPYTGPVEVTRFVAPPAQRAALGEGTIAISFPDEITNEGARRAFAAAISAELAALGYTLTQGRADQTAKIRTSRNTIVAETQNNRGPVSVGVGGQTGSYGSGVGLGVGVNLGGGRESANIMTELSVRITQGDNATLWEGRAQIATGVKSPFSQVDTSARTLAAALFRDFPGGDGETVTIKVKELQGTQ